MIIKGFMNMAKLYSLVLLMLGGIHIVLALYVWNKRTTVANRNFSAFMTAMALYSIGYAFEIQVVSMKQVLFWSNIQYLGISVIPALVILLSMSMMGKEYWVRPFILGILFFIPAVTFILHLTAPCHNLYYQSPVLVFRNGFTLLFFDKGPWYLVHVAYMNISFLLAFLLSLQMIARGRGAYRKQAVIFFTASMIPWIVFMIYLAKITPAGLDINPLGFSGCGLLLTIGLYRYRLLDLVPVARDSVFFGMSDAVLVFDTGDRLVDYNRAARGIVSDIARRHVGLHASVVFSRYPSLLRQIDDLSETMEVTIVDDTTERVYRSRVSQIRDRKGSIQGRAFVLSDVTEQIDLLRQMTTMATMDYLTGIPNRRYFISRCESEISRAARNSKPVSIGIMDLDFFKNINDTHGHAAGDLLLASVAGICLDVLRSFDTIGRWGGEEFAILLPDTDLSDAGHIAERLRQAIAELRIPYRDTELSINASFGITEMSHNGIESVDELVKRADEALYMAKKLGRNRVQTCNCPVDAVL